MKRAAHALLLIACAAKGEPAVQVASVTPVAGTAIADSPSSDARGVRFPAGRGVRIVDDDLIALFRDPTFIDQKRPYEERVAIARRLLDVPGEAMTYLGSPATKFIALGGASEVGPYYCQSMIVSSNPPFWDFERVPSPLCGLPYTWDPKAAYDGPAPKTTVTDLRHVAAQIVGLGDAAARTIADAQLGASTSETPMWLGIGPRGDEAPFTCWSLRLDGAREVKPEPLATCGYAWPLPASQFDPGPPVPPLPDGCDRKCGPREICVVDEERLYGAEIRVDTDGRRAHFPDGKPAPTKVRSFCTPIPIGCPVVEQACFFTMLRGPNAPPPPVLSPPTTPYGPCQPETFYTASFVATTPHIVCNSVYRAEGVAVSTFVPLRPWPHTPVPAPLPRRSSSTP